MKQAPSHRVISLGASVVFLAVVILLEPSTGSARQTRHDLVSLTGVAWEASPGGVAVVVHVSGPVTFGEGRLTTPDRYYVDLHNAKIGSDIKRVHAIQGDVLNAIRIGQFRRGTVRIVLDLGARPVAVQAALHENPYRIRVLIRNVIRKEDIREGQTAGPSEGLVPKDQRITDVDARLALARVLAYEHATLSESVRQYRILQEQKPGDPVIRIEMAGVLIRSGDHDGARSLIKTLDGSSLSDPNALAVLADVEAGLGHAAQCRDLYLKAIAKSDEPERLRLKLADRMNLWGDFYKAEAIYRERLAAHPDDKQTTLQLAALLRSCERYPESEGIYRSILASSGDLKKIHLELARVKLLEKDQRAADREVGKFLDLYPDDPEGLGLKADILFFQKRFDDALGIYRRVSEMTCCRVKGLMGMGKVCLEQGKGELARELFVQGRKLDPQNVECRYYLEGRDRATSDGFVNALVNDRRISAVTLEQWARLYSEKGYHKTAIRCYEASLERDPDYFPSQIGLAEVLAIDHQYDPATERFEALSRLFPDNRKILIGFARTLAWGRQYDAAIAAYDRIHRLAPGDPVPLIEKARTAAWAKEMDLALNTYDALLSPSVDGELARDLRPVAETSGSPNLIAAVQRLAGDAERGSIFRGFQASNEDLNGLRASLSAETNNRIDAAKNRLDPQFAIQKGAYLEREGKRLNWNRRPTQALDVYEELIAFAPGNQEAIFDYAQLQCSMGLCDREGAAYRQLLDIDPLHSLAGGALKRLEIRRSPSIRVGQTYWSERGREGLTAIDRYRTDLGLAVPVDCRFYVRVDGHHWVEHPSYTHDSYGANGFTIGVGGVLNPYIKGEAGWTQKMYRDSRFENTDTGYAHIWLNLRDYVRVGLGYDRTDELYNYFGIRQATQADAWSLSLDSHLTRSLELMGQARYMGYSDNNDGRHFTAGAGYEFTDHPRIFKVSLTGEYRNTRKMDAYHYTGDRLVDITHPYWTPHDYYGGGLTVEWHHDLSRLLFCGSELHFYDLAMTVGTDTEHNPSIELRGGWHYEFLDHWTLSFKGLIHRSKLWDAEGIWVDLKYQF